MWLPELGRPARLLAFLDLLFPDSVGYPIGN